MLLVSPFLGLDLSNQYLWAPIFIIYFLLLNVLMSNAQVRDHSLMMSREGGTHFCETSYTGVGKIAI